MKTFPIPLVAIGPGTQTEDEQLDYVSMPTDMNTFRPPVLPEPEQIAAREMTKSALVQVLNLLKKASEGHEGGQIDVMDLPDEDRTLINQVLSEGEASALLKSEETHSELRIQESVFAGVWRILAFKSGELVGDVIEVGAVPQALRKTALEDGQSVYRPWSGPLPPNVQNAPLLVEEIRDEITRWQPGQPSHVVNLSLLPVSLEDIGFLDHQLGTGRVLLLSRGYGNCRITNTLHKNCWRVVYFNSFDKVILNTVEVVDMPDVAMAAVEDLFDSYERLQDVVAYLESA